MIPAVCDHRRIGRGLVGLLLFSVSGVVIGAGDPRLTYRLVEPGEIDISILSPIGREVLRRPDKWMIGRSENFLVFTGSMTELTEFVGQAEHAHNRAGQIFLLGPSSTNPAYLVSIQSDREWRRLNRRHGIRQDGLAMQIGRELYLKADAEQVKRADRVAHEVVHLRLAEAFGALPLWLDEGLAGHYGWLFAVEYQGRRDVLLYRNQPALAEKDLLGLDTLLYLKNYPHGEQAARAFYRQSEELVDLLAARMRPQDWNTFLNDMKDQGSDTADRFRRVLVELRLDESTIIKEMKARCLAPRKP